MSDEYENLVSECKEEIRVFERPQARNSIALIDAVEQLQKENADLNTLLDSCYNDICRPSGKISKSTAQVLYIRECSKILTLNKEE
jgi:hypothetical protein